VSSCWIVLGIVSRVGVYSLLLLVVVVCWMVFVGLYFTSGVEWLEGGKQASLFKSAVVF
jgi:hypothetical protein